MYYYRTVEPRSNGLPALEVTWYGIKPYDPLDRPGDFGHVVAIKSEDSIELWLIDTLDRICDLMALMLLRDTPVHAYSVMKPLPAFQ